MASDAFSMVVELLRQSSAALSDPALSAQELRAHLQAMSGGAPPLAGTSVEPVSIDGVSCEWIRPAVDVAPDACVLYLHGGGYAIGSCDTHRPLASHLAARSGLSVLLVDYRLAPEHAYPAALDDALTVYDSLLARGFDPGRIVVAGDSAGGGLTLATLLALRDRGRPLPALAVPISPWTDLTLSGESMASVGDRDPMVTRHGLQRMVDWYLDGGDATAPLVSPRFSDPTGLPPLLIHVGEVEILRDDAVGTVRGRAAANAGVDVTLEVWPEMIHVWHVFGPDVPESEAAVARVAEFIAERLALPAPVGA